MLGRVPVAPMTSVPPRPEADPVDPVEAADELIGYLSRSGYTEGTSK